MGHCGFNQGEAEMKQMIAVMLLISGAAMRAWVNWERR
nr:MAG TPA: Tail tape measure [Caudoviricetes sp.]